MKRPLTIISVLIILLTTVSCYAKSPPHDKLNIATSAYALKYFIEQVGGEAVNVTFSFTGNPHHAELTQRDGVALMDSDAFFNVEAGDYVDFGWQLRNLNRSMQYFDVSENIELLLNDNDHKREESASSRSDETDTQKKQRDPHVWLDPQRASILVTNITAALSQLNRDKREYFERNSVALQTKLTALDETLRRDLSVRTKPYILVNHPAYGYLANRYDLIQKAIHDVSDHGENTQASIIALDEFITEHDIRYVFIEPSTETSNIIDVLSAKYNLERETLFNIETPVTESTDYFVLMEQNGDHIKKAIA